MSAAPLTPTLPAPTTPRPPARLARVERIAALILSLACLGILGLSAMLRPDTAGHGTHQQLGLPKCGMVIAFGRPCPTCGMTTAFAHAAAGDLKSSFLAQPAGCLGAVCIAAAFWVGLYIALTGSRVGEQCGKLFVPRVLWPALGIWLAAWAYKLATWQG